MSALILVIEDNATNIELMTYLLEAFGHRTVRARDGVEGLTVARSEMPDLILCDIQLPELDGYGVARTLSQDSQLAGIPRIAVTALAMRAIGKELSRRDSMPIFRSRSTPRLSSNRWRNFSAAGNDLHLRRRRPQG